MRDKYFKSIKNSDRKIYVIVDYSEPAQKEIDSYMTLSMFMFL